MSNTMDISSIWWTEFKESYALRVAQNIGWPTNFVTKFEDIVASGGSWGVTLSETSLGNVVSIYGTDDPDVSCSFGGSVSTGYYGCFADAGYGVVRADYFTHSSYGGNGCYAGCTSNNMNIYSAPTVIAASGSGNWAAVISNTNPVTTKFFVWNFNNQYPSGYEGEILPTNKQSSGSNEYVAMGDSYSSGEGSPSFDSWTVQPGVNECHRSVENAYPKLLAAEGNLDLDLERFVACSGATTDSVLDEGQWNELAQVDALSETTDVVTLTLGGNDVRFVDYATSCEASGFCDEENSAYEDIMNAIDGDLSWKLETVYQEILDRAENATVYVTGYPYLVDPTAECVSFGWADDLGVLDVIDHLNDTIHAAVNAVESSTAEPTNAGRIEYVEPNGAGSPFEDHYLCSMVPYFHGAIVSPDPAYSFHPNQLGQDAYKALFAEALD